MGNTLFLLFSDSFHWAAFDVLRDDEVISTIKSPIILNCFFFFFKEKDHTNLKYPLIIF
jgi:hypothetical protein